MDNKLIIYLTRLSLFFYSPEKGIKLDFPEDTVKDLEIINKKQLSDLIQATIDNYKIAPLETIIILSPDTLFEKNIPIEATSEIPEKIKSFIELVPFANVAFKVTRLKEGYKVITANKDFYKTVEDVFTQKGFRVSAVVPLPLLSELKAPTDNELNSDTLQYLFKKYEALKETDLTLDSQENTPQTENADNKPDKKRNIMLLVIIAASFLIILLLSIIFIFLAKPNKSVKANQFVTPKITP